MKAETTEPTLDQLTWLDPKQLERFYGMKNTHQKHLRKQNRIPYSKVGSYIRYKKSEIEAWLDAGKVA